MDGNRRVRVRSLGPIHYGPVEDHCEDEISAGRREERRGLFKWLEDGKAFLRWWTALDFALIPLVLFLFYCTRSRFDTVCTVFAALHWVMIPFVLLLP